MTMVNLAADSRLAGGAGAAWFRRVGAIVSMGLGALAAAAVIRSLSGSWALVLAGVLMALAPRPPAPRASYGRPPGRPATGPIPTPTPYVQETLFSCVSAIRSRHHLRCRVKSAVYTWA